MAAKKPQPPPERDESEWINRPTSPPPPPKKTDDRRGSYLDVDTSALFAEIADLKRQLAEVEGCAKRLLEERNTVCHQLTALRDQNAKLRSALKEYGDSARWYTGGHGTLEVVFDSFDEDQHGWEPARAALRASDESEVGDA